MERVRFQDRFEAGHVLAVQLAHYASRSGTVVLGVPRGGLAVAYPVACMLNAPLDALLVRELHVPGKTSADSSLGVVAAGGIRVVNEAVVQRLGIGADELDRATTEASLELTRLEQGYHTDHERLDVRGQTVIVIDDGLARGSTLKPAVSALRQQKAARVVVATPVASTLACRELSDVADEVVWVVSTERPVSVESWYHDFAAVTDDEVCELLARGREDAEAALSSGWRRSSMPSFTGFSPEPF